MYVGCSFHFTISAHSDTVRELYRTRLDVFFNHYPSKNFDNRPWGELSEIILVCLSIVLAVLEHQLMFKGR